MTSIFYYLRRFLVDSLIVYLYCDFQNKDMDTAPLVAPASVWPLGSGI